MITDCRKCMFYSEKTNGLLTGRSWYCYKTLKNYDASELGMNFTCELYIEASDAKEES